MWERNGFVGNVINETRGKLSHVCVSFSVVVPSFDFPPFSSFRSFCATYKQHGTQPKATSEKRFRVPITSFSLFLSPEPSVSCYLNERKRGEIKINKKKKTRRKLAVDGKRKKKRKRTPSFVVCSYKKEKRANPFAVLTRGGWSLNLKKNSPVVQGWTRATQLKNIFIRLGFYFFREKKRKSLKGRWGRTRSFRLIHYWIITGLATTFVSEARWIQNISYSPQNEELFLIFPELEWTCRALTTNYHLTTIGK